MSKPSASEYFFYEWLIIEKKMTLKQFKKLSYDELQKLKIEYKLFLED